MFVHCVYFWLRDDLTAEEEQHFTDGLESLVGIESVKAGYVGTPASTDRPIIDRSYSYALVIVCEDQAAHDAYQEDAVHDDFRETCSSLWTDVKIYDFTDAAERA